MPRNQTQTSAARCYCGNTVEYSSCCGRYLDGGDIPQKAEQLMRSRYCGFVLRDEDYLLATWHPTTRPSRVRMDEQQNWLGLRICSVDKGDCEDNTGTVEFVARFKIAGKGHRLHECSRFEKIDGRWFYLDGKHL